MRAALRRRAGVRALAGPDRIHRLRSTSLLTLRAVALIVPWIAGVGLLAPCQARAAEVERFTGTARGPSGAVLYVEEHEVALAGGRPRTAVTTYLDPAGVPIAELRTDFSGDPSAPSYDFVDLRSGVREAVTVGEREVRLEAGERAATVPRPARLTTGQGLDRLVRARLSSLADGEEVRVRYAIPSRLDAYEFRIRGRALDDQRVRVRVELSSFLLRLFAPDLVVDYERGSGRLLRYRGASNLSFGPPGREENPQVEIVYSYPEVALTAGQEVDRRDP
jgi:hypothetical protein